MTQVALFGASGRTGIHVVDEALRRNYEVVAHTRSPDKLRRNDARLRVVEGDLADRVSIDETIRGSGAVVSVLGPASNKEKFVVHSGMARMVSSMKEHGARRLVITAGAAVPDKNDAPTFMSRLMGLLVRTISKNVYEDMLHTVELVRGSDLDWTVVRVPMLTDEPKTGVVKVTWVGKGMGRQVTRGDLATFVVDQIEVDTYLHQAPVVSN